jgi:hypothetical protein
MADLILTNGDTAAGLLAAAGKAGTIQPWRDVLHEGPVVADLEASTKLRVDFLARRFRVDADGVAASFAERDALIRNHAAFDRIELWFEHDLYDQLQLLQILAFFAEAGRAEGITLVQADQFLGAQTAATILRFAAKARPIDRLDLTLARDVWGDVAATDPKWVARRLADSDRRLPFLKPALRRFLEELPAPEIGLGRTEATALLGIADGVSNPGMLFRQLLVAEEAAFMGDRSFFRLLDDLAFCQVPLIACVDPPGEAEDDDRYDEATLELTMAGADVARGAADHVALSGLDRWWGGTHLEGRAVWRYDPATMTLVAPAAPGA